MPQTYTITFPARFRREPHPFFGDCPELPDSYGYIIAGTREEAVELANTAFGRAWSIVSDGDYTYHAAHGVTLDRLFPAGHLFTIRADRAGLPVLTFSKETP